ncbi:MAG TPA: helix-turn-helix domain-containing protein [Bryobacteraceae bacterium]|nr:helix-turn-helix domain-containing protein [Bryobacteraceae bacterium]
MSVAVEPKVTPAYLRPEQAAKFLSISPSLLVKEVRKGQGPRQRRVGRVVLYGLADLQAWMDQKVHQ